MASAVSSALVVTAVAPAAVSAEGNQHGSFSDVPADAFAKDAIENLVAKGVIEGYDDGTYRPAQSVTRAETARMLVKLLGLPVDTREEGVHLSDTDGHWAEEEIRSLVHAGIAEGYSDGSFRPEEAVTRSEMAAMLKRAFALDATAGGQPFSDVEEEDWFHEAVSALYEIGITEGRADVTFAPDDPVKRDEMALFLNRADQKAEITRTIEDVEEDAVIMNGIRYETGSFDGLANEKLVGSSLSIEAEDGVIQAVHRLVLDEQLTGAFDGEGMEINALTITSENLSIKNVTVHGETVIKAPEKQVGASVLGINTLSEDSLTFSDFSSDSVSVEEERSIRYEEGVSVADTYIRANASLSSSDGDDQNVTLTEGVTEVALTGDFDNLTIESTGDVSITGEVTAGQVTVRSTDLRVTLPERFSSESVDYPEGATGEDVFTDFGDISDRLSGGGEATTPDPSPIGGDTDDESDGTDNGDESDEEGEENEEDENDEESDEEGEETDGDESPENEGDESTNGDQIDVIHALDILEVQQHDEVNLPEEVKVTYQDGTKGYESVEWDQSKISTAYLGTEEYFGSIEGTEKEVRIDVDVQGDGITIFDEGTSALVNTEEALDQALEIPEIETVNISASDESFTINEDVDKEVAVISSSSVTIKGTGTLAHITAERGGLNLDGITVKHMEVDDEASDIVLRNVTDHSGSVHTWESKDGQVTLENTKLRGEVHVKAEDGLRIDGDENSELAGLLRQDTQESVIDVNVKTNRIVTEQANSVTVIRDEVSHMMVREDGIVYIDDPDLIAQAERRSGVEVDERSIGEMASLSLMTMADPLFVQALDTVELAFIRDRLNTLITQQEDNRYTSEEDAEHGQYSDSAYQELLDERDRIEDELAMDAPDQEAMDERQAAVDDLADNARDAITAFGESRVLTQDALTREIYSMERSLAINDPGPDASELEENAFTSFRDEVTQAEEQLEQSLTQRETEDLIESLREGYNRFIRQLALSIEEPSEHELTFFLEDPVEGEVLTPHLKIGYETSRGSVNVGIPELNEIRDRNRELTELRIDGFLNMTEDTSTVHYGLMTTKAAYAGSFSIDAYNDGKIFPLEMTDSHVSYTFDLDERLDVDQKQIDIYRNTGVKNEKGIDQYQSLGTFEGDELFLPEGEYLFLIRARGADHVMFMTDAVQVSGDHDGYSLSKEDLEPVTFELDQDGLADGLDWSMDLVRPPLEERISEAPALSFDGDKSAQTLYLDRNLQLDERHVLRVAAKGTMKDDFYRVNYDFDAVPDTSSVKLDTIFNAEIEESTVFNNFRNHLSSEVDYKMWDSRENEIGLIGIGNDETGQDEAFVPDYTLYQDGEEVPFDDTLFGEGEVRVEYPDSELNLPTVTDTFKVEMTENHGPPRLVNEDIKHIEVSYNQSVFKDLSRYFEGSEMTFSNFEVEGMDHLTEVDGSRVRVDASQAEPALTHEDLREYAYTVDVKNEFGEAELSGVIHLQPPERTVSLREENGSVLLELRQSFDQEYLVPEGFDLYRNDTNQFDGAERINDDLIPYDPDGANTFEDQEKVFLDNAYYFVRVIYKDNLTSEPGEGVSGMTQTLDELSQLELDDQLAVIEEGVRLTGMDVNRNFVERVVDMRDQLDEAMDAGAITEEELLEIDEYHKLQKVLDHLDRTSTPLRDDQVTYTPVENAIGYDVTITDLKPGTELHVAYTERDEKVEVNEEGVATFTTDNHIAHYSIRKEGEKPGFYADLGIEE